jgi:hypothetical protein
MKRRFFTFNSETLQTSRLYSRALVLALVVLLGLEIAVRVLVARGLLPKDDSLDILVERQTRAVVEQKPQVWMLGNSTLAWGVDEELLGRITGRSVMKIMHGSASVEGSAAMLGHYLSRAPVRPRLVILCLTKDDLNAHPRSTRQSLSRDYLQFQWRAFLPSNWLYLRACRRGLVERLSWQKGLLFHARNHWLALRGLPPMERAAPPAPRDHEFRYDGSPIPPEDAFYTRLAWGYSMRPKAFEKLARASDGDGNPRVLVLMMPVTSSYVEWHDARHPETPHRTVVSRVEEWCAANGLLFMDMSRVFSDPGLFQDPHHLNAFGKEQFTELLGGSLGNILDGGKDNSSSATSPSPVQ